jgi:hypothetical protein
MLVLAYCIVVALTCSVGSALGAGGLLRMLCGAVLLVSVAIVVAFGFFI